jgi:glyoxylase-like metal-dependent hydrolase (beta-lactamase superfamily II)
MEFKVFGRTIKMNTEIYRFQIGDFSCMAIYDGTMKYGPPAFAQPAQFFFGSAPQDKLREALLRYQINLDTWTEWSTDYTCLFIDTGQQKILVDTGAGNLSPTTGKLPQNLQKEGISPADITLVIITHAHPDHIGGNMDQEGKQVFPNARWAIWRDEWKFWTSTECESKLDKHSGGMLINIARNYLLPVQDKLDLLDQEVEIVPGIRPLHAPGHTPGMIALEIASGSAKLLLVSDLVLHPLHLEHPEWCAAVDVMPDQVALSRRKILKRAAAEKTLMLAFHFPFPGLGYVAPLNKGWQWKPTGI